MSHTNSSYSPMRVFICPQCGRIASVATYCARPICLHTWDGNVPEIWDADDVNGGGRKMEASPNPEMRVPGPTTWAQMITWSGAVEEANGAYPDD